LSWLLSIAKYGRKELAKAAIKQITK